MLRTALVTLTLISAAGAITAEAVDVRSPVPAIRGPGIRVWTTGGDLFRRNERVRVSYRTESDAFVTVLRVDTDGRVRVLFPRHAGDDNFAIAGRSYSVSGWDRGTAFVVDDYPGVGYVFAIASSEPFDYRTIYEGDRWDLRRVSDGRIHGDPRSTLEELMIELLPRDFEEFDTHITPYHVERRYDYPRFVCYDCHAYVPYYSWNPYSAWCRSYSLVVWNDPWYYYPSHWYPTRYYGGRRVVYSYPSAPARYVFKAREGTAAGVDYRRRDVATYVRRPEDRGVRASDIGGVGQVPAPRAPDRRTAPDRPTGDQPREPREPREPRAIEGGGRRTAGAAPDVSRPETRGEQRPEGRGRTEVSQPSAPSQAAPETRRRSAEPGIEIVPDRPGVARPDTRGTPRSSDPAPETRRAERSEPEPRAATREQPRTEPSERPRTERPQSERPQTERAQPRPETRPAPAPETRSRPEASRPASPPPQSRPEPRAAPRQPAQPSGSGGLVRRRPD